MKRKVEYLGAPINIPYLISGLQDNIEENIGEVLETIVTPGVVLKYSTFNGTETVSGQLKIVNDNLYITACTLVFPESPYKVISLPETLIQSGIAAVIGTSVGTRFRVFASLEKADSGIRKTISNRFVYNETLDTTGPSEIIDSVVFEISSAKNQASNEIILGYVAYDTSSPTHPRKGLYYYSGPKLIVDQSEGVCDKSVLDLDAVHSGRILALNSSNETISSEAQAGIGIIGPIENGENFEVVEMFGFDGTRWTSTSRISGHDPVEDTDLTTKGWITNEYAPYVITGMNDSIRSSSGDIVNLVMSPGLIMKSREDSIIEGKLYILNGNLYLSACTIVFPHDPYILVRLESDVLVKSGISAFIGTNQAYNWHVYAGINFNSIDETNFVREYTVDFIVSNDVNDAIVGGVELGYLHYQTSTGTLLKWEQYVSNLKIRISQADGSYTKAILDLDAIHGGRVLELNSNHEALSSSTKAGIGIIGPIENGENFEIVEILGFDGTRWTTTSRISGHDPIEDTDLTTKQWVEDYLNFSYLTVTNPVNLRITDIRSATMGEFIQVAEVEKISGKYINQNNSLLVKFEWGYTDLIGDAVAGTNIYTHTGNYLFPVDGLIGQAVWFPTLNKNLRIADNTATALTLTEVNGDTFTFQQNLSLHTSGSASNPIIHSNVNEYQILAIPYSVNTPLPYSAVSALVTTGSINPLPLSVELQLSVGTKYGISFRGIKGSTGDWVAMSAGTFSKTYPISGDTIDKVSYSNPFLAVPPPIGDPAGTWSATAVAGGFEVYIGANKWVDAETFGLIHVPMTVEDPVFSDNEEIVFQSRNVFIPVPITGPRVIRLRPLIAGYQVSDPETTTLIGTTVLDTKTTILWSKDFKVYTRSGSLKYTAHTSYNCWDIMSFREPAYAVSGIDVTVDDVYVPFSDNDIVSVEGLDCRWARKGNLNGIFLFNASNNNLITGAVGEERDFVSGVTAGARRIGVFTCSGKTEILSIDLDITGLDIGGRAEDYPVLRAYPRESTNDGDSVVIRNPGDSQNPVSFIVESGGQVIVDCYDPNGLNYSCIAGSVSIRGRIV